MPEYLLEALKQLLERRIEFTENYLGGGGGAELARDLCRMDRQLEVVKELLADYPSFEWLKQIWNENFYGGYDSLEAYKLDNPEERRTNE